MRAVKWRVSDALLTPCGKDSDNRVQMKSELFKQDSVLERKRTMAKGRGVAKLPPKWKNGSAGNKSLPPPPPPTPRPRTPLSFHSQPETSLDEEKKNTTSPNGFWNSLTFLRPTASSPHDSANGSGIERSFDLISRVVPEIDSVIQPDDEPGGRCRIRFARCYNLDRKLREWKLLDSARCIRLVSQI